MSQALVNHLGRPMAQERVPTASRDSGSMRGSISNYRPRRVYSQAGESAERILTQDRAQDLYANDFGARSAVDSIATNAVGTGLMPQPRFPLKRLGITEEQAFDVKEQMEWNWAEWCEQAHVSGTMHFEDIQFSGLSSVLRMGELLHLPVRQDPAPKNARTYSLALQTLTPRRLVTPADKIADPSVRDGVHVNEYGKPLGYWIAAPTPSAFGSGAWTSHAALSSRDFRYSPARIAHRPGAFHIFRHTEEEQVRGVSSLSTAVKLFRNMTDAIDYELLAQVLAASFPVFIGQEEGRPGLPSVVMEQYNLADPATGERERSFYQEVEAGQFIYGAKGEKPYILESKRPSANFMAFVELILRAQGASMGIPYEVLLKDFSKTNYSSARAALNEAWKVFQMYRSWFARLYCQPLWNMVQEEAYLRGRLILPSSAPGFYQARFMWCNAYWYGPSRGYVDPVKEIQANLLAIDNRLMPRTEHWAQQGGDFWEGMDQIEAEELRMQRMPKATPVTGTKKSGASRKEAQSDDDAEDKQGDDDADE